MAHRTIVPGWRYFECEECNEQWRSKCRDYYSSSSEFCLSCNDCCEPYKHEPRPEWPIDKHGNLLEEDE